MWAVSDEGRCGIRHSSAATLNARFEPKPDKRLLLSSYTLAAPFWSFGLRHIVPEAAIAVDVGVDHVGSYPQTWREILYKVRNIP